MDNARPTPLIDDAEATRERLEGWFSSRKQTPVQISELVIPENSGMSNVTLLFDIHWQERGVAQTLPCVGRLQPLVDNTVFPEYDLSLQYEVMASIGAHSDIPVPVLLGIESDPGVLGVPFYVMQRQPGRIPPDMPPYNMDGWMLQELDELERADLWRNAVSTLARFHRLEPGDLGLTRLATPTHTSPLQHQLDYWQHYHDWAFAGEQHVIGQQALDWLRQNQPRDEPLRVCWGDARLGNIIFDPQAASVACVLDWEMATLGNPIQDIAWFNYLDRAFSDGLGVPRLPGLPDHASTLQQWAQESGHGTAHYDYYEIFAGMRFGLLLSRIMLATDQAAEVQGNFACQLLSQGLQQAQGAA